jgi:hypothetical protein
MVLAASICSLPTSARMGYHARASAGHLITEARSPLYRPHITITRSGDSDGWICPGSQADGKSDHYRSKKKPVHRASGSHRPRTGTDVSACGRLPRKSVPGLASSGRSPCHFGWLVRNARRHGRVPHGRSSQPAPIHCLNALLKLACKLELARVIQLLNAILELRSQRATARICKGCVE